MPNEIVIPQEKILNKIYNIRDQKVMIDSDLATLYGVETKVLKQAVRRNSIRFPEDFMFELSQEEFDTLRSQIVTSSWGGTRYRPMAFTEQGIAMLSSVLNSAIAVKVNIQIIRTFVKMREMLLTHKDLLAELEKVKEKLGVNRKDIDLIFSYLKQLEKAKHEEKTQKERKQIGFKF